MDSIRQPTKGGKKRSTPEKKKIKRPRPNACEGFVSNTLMLRATYVLANGPADGNQSPSSHQSACRQGQPLPIKLANSCVDIWWQSNCQVQQIFVAVEVGMQGGVLPIELNVEALYDLGYMEVRSSTNNMRAGPRVLGQVASDTGKIEYRIGQEQPHSSGRYTCISSDERTEDSEGDNVGAAQVYQTDEGGPNQEQQFKRYIYKEKTNKDHFKALDVFVAEACPIEWVDEGDIAMSATVTFSLRTQQEPDKERSVKFYRAEFIPSITNKVNRAAWVLGGLPSATSAAANQQKSHPPVLGAQCEGHRAVIPGDDSQQVAHDVATHEALPVEQVQQAPSNGGGWYHGGTHTTAPPAPNSGAAHEPCAADMGEVEEGYLSELLLGCSLSDMEDIFGLPGMQSDDKYDTLVNLQDPTQMQLADAAAAQNQPVQSQSQGITVSPEEASLDIPQIPYGNAAMMCTWKQRSPREIEPYTVYVDHPTEILTQSTCQAATEADLEQDIGWVVDQPCRAQDVPQVSQVYVENLLNVQGYFASEAATVTTQPSYVDTKRSMHVVKQTAECKTSFCSEPQYTTCGCAHLFHRQQSVGSHSMCVPTTGWTRTMQLAHHSIQTQEKQVSSHDDQHAQQRQAVQSDTVAGAPTDPGALAEQVNMGQLSGQLAPWSDTQKASCLMSPQCTPIQCVVSRSRCAQQESPPISSNTQRLGLRTSPDSSRCAITVSTTYPGMHASMSEFEGVHQHQGNGEGSTPIELGAPSTLDWPHTGYEDPLDRFLEENDCGMELDIGEVLDFGALDVDIGCDG